jgi:hypothetical protein
MTRPPDSDTCGFGSDVFPRRAAVEDWHVEGRLTPLVDDLRVTFVASW